jgi:multiple sugar transport system ATP-binding protein
MGDRIVVLRAGRVEQVGTPVALYERPANRFVAGFIGTPAMNFLELAVVPNDNTTAASGAAPIYPYRAATDALWLPLTAALAAGRNKLVMGTRPEHLRLCGEGETTLPCLATRVEAIEFMGASSQLSLSSMLGPLVVSTGERPALQVGDRVQVAIDPSRVHFFDADSGLRLDA